MYQTAGNLAADGRAALLFIDWPSGGVLQLSGRAMVTVRETGSVSTFRFVAPRRVAFAPGQYATLRLAGLPGVPAPVTRTWTLSGAARSAAAGDDTLEVSVQLKVAGRVDAPLLRRLGVGAAAPPATGWGEWVCLCGPPGWMAGVRAALGGLGVRGEAVMTEGFDF
ncbi:hypothetical protein I4F81_005696 [Pyropia yezoensis]|uniref:Uncharacterized protein n=1 Tax=Pyropia yezoensis TaxID=2788 RepID=A0ACC3BYK4_PYRYE|nr:hypothetical protein I4F81_005696 [Neopyropia yezoensis]